MKSTKRDRLEANGWKIGTAEELLGLSREEAAYIELRIRLSDAVRTLRRQRSMTQVQVARLLHSSQSRIAKAEAADESVSLDLLIRSLLALGATDHDLAQVIHGLPRTRSAAR
jgi:predicted XRE-type DNA-binding protein